MNSNNGVLEFLLSAKTGELSTAHHPLGPGELWHQKDKSIQLPAYIQNIASALERSGHDESSAIAIAVGTVKRWSGGGGNVSPEVKAAAEKALAEWEALKSRAKSTK